MLFAGTFGYGEMGSEMDPRFGRAPYFLLVDTETGEHEVVENSAIAASGGAGIAAAQLVVDRGVSHVLTGNCGPNAFRVLDAAGIGVVIGAGGSVSDAVARFVNGELKATGGASVRGHWGSGAGSR